VKLTADNVETVLLDCLFHDDEDMDNRIEVEGILHTYGFHPERLQGHAQDVIGMINCLPHQFLAPPYGEGGWSFLNMCDDKDGVQWTGLHQTMEHLCVLAIGLGLGKWLMPRDMWKVFPGGMPYVAFYPQGV
jgi:hypothetical protein